MFNMYELSIWESRFLTLIERLPAQSDVVHDLEHIRRVVANAKKLSTLENSKIEIVLPSAWLHDCANIPKSSPLRSKASVLAAQEAADFLRDSNYPTELIPAIQHAIETHSFSANIAPQTLEAKVVQDADRLDALGAIGIARCLMLGGAMGRQLYNPEFTFSKTYMLDDTVNVIDHFYTKLFKLADMMLTGSGRQEAQRRTKLMYKFIQQLDKETRGEFYGDKIEEF